MYASENKKNKILILGVGNPLRGDDGIGPVIITRLQGHNLDNCDLVDGGVDGLALIDTIGKYPRAIIVDAVHMKAKPGAVRVFNPEEAKIHIRCDTLSTHGFGLAEVLGLLKNLNIKTQITIIGVEPRNLNFGEGLSLEVENKIEEILRLIQKQVN